MNNISCNNTVALCWQLLRQDIRARYHGTVLGGLWLVLQPLFMLMVYALIFGEVLQLRLGAEVSGSDFVFYLFAGLIVFNALGEVMTRSTVLMQEKRDMLLNTALPPWLLPVVPVLVSVLLEWLALLILLLAMSWQGQFSLIGLILYLPYFFIRCALSLALAFIITPFAVFLQDLRQLMPALLTVLLLVSPILYPLTVIPERFLPFYDWNLLGQLVQGYREALLEGGLNSTRFLLLALVSSTLLGFAVWLFHRLMPRARYVL